MEGTTSIDDLPISPQSEANIQLETRETNTKIDSTINNMREQREAEISSALGPGPGPGPGAGPGPGPGVGAGHSGLGENVNKFVSGVQEAVASGALGLQFRDVPQSQTHITQDAQMQPNFVPAQEQEDYIGASQTNGDVVREHNEKRKVEESYDTLFDNLQTPVLLAILYFIFQLPVVKQTVFRLVPALFKKDGTPNLYGYITHSISFATVYTAAMMTLKYFSI
tara:strand:- start:768 stop:1439 length:672 start_codon:yes stop_codon:yes gene_type:complete